MKNRIHLFKENDFNDIADKDLDCSGVDSVLDQLTAQSAQQMAGALDLACHNFAEQHEGRKLTTSEVIALNKGRFIKLKTHAQEEPHGWECFFCWGREVMAYRILTGSHVNENTQAAYLDTTLQSLWLPESEWPEAVRNFLEGEK